MKLNIPDSDARDDNQIFTVTSFSLHREGVTESDYLHFQDEVPQCEYCVGDKKLLAPYQSKDIFVMEVDADERYYNGKTMYYICSRCKDIFMDFYRSARPIHMYQVKIKWPSKL